MQEDFLFFFNDRVGELADAVDFDAHCVAGFEPAGRI